jgi:hypothetical protein
MGRNAVSVDAGSARRAAAFAGQIPSLGDGLDRAMDADAEAGELSREAFERRLQLASQGAALVAEKQIARNSAQYGAADHGWDNSRFAVHAAGLLQVLCQPFCRSAVNSGGVNE